MGRLLALLVVRAAAVAVALPATTRRFFGPQDFVLNATGAPLVVFEDSQQLCEQEQRGLAGSIVVWKPRGALITDLRCSTERLYIHAARAGAVALIIVAPEFDRPGRFYYDHDGSAGGLTGGGRMVLLDMAAPDFASLKRATAAPASALVLSPTANPWQVSIDHWATILAFRVLLPAIALTAGARAYSNRLALGENFVGPTAVVLMIEMVTLPVLAVVWILGAYAGSAWLASSVARFFYLGFTGWATLSTLLLAQHWRAQSRLQFGALVSSTTAQVARDPRSVRKQAPWYFALGTVTVGVETYFSAMLASYRMATGIKLIAAACILVNLCISGYFIAQACRLNTRVLSVLSVRLPGTRAHLRRVAAWLALSGWCTVLYSGGTVLFIAHGEKLFWWHFSLGVCALGRVLNSFAQIRSLDPPLDELDEPAPDATYTCGDATYGDDEEKCVGDEAAFQPLQIPIKELLFSIVHGKDVPAAAGDFELSVRDNALDSMMFLHTSPAPALILDEQACVVMWSVGMERVLGAGAPLRHGMPLAELPFSTSVGRLARRIDDDPRFRHLALGVYPVRGQFARERRACCPRPRRQFAHAPSAEHWHHHDQLCSLTPRPRRRLRCDPHRHRGRCRAVRGAQRVGTVSRARAVPARFDDLVDHDVHFVHAEFRRRERVGGAAHASFRDQSRALRDNLPRHLGRAAQRDQRHQHAGVRTRRGSRETRVRCARATAEARTFAGVTLCGGARLHKQSSTDAACTGRRGEPRRRRGTRRLRGDASYAAAAQRHYGARHGAELCHDARKAAAHARSRAHLERAAASHRARRRRRARQPHSDAPPRVAHGDVARRTCSARRIRRARARRVRRACVIAPSPPQGGATPPAARAPPVRPAAYYLAPELRGAGARMTTTSRARRWKLTCSRSVAFSRGSRRRAAGARCSAGLVRRDGRPVRQRGLRFELRAPARRPGARAGAPRARTGRRCAP